MKETEATCVPPGRPLRTTGCEHLLKSIQEGTYVQVLFAVATSR